MDNASIHPIAIHELANIVPMANELEQEALRKDIERNGFIRSAGLITLWNGEVVDGRCRMKACIAVGLEPREYTNELGDLSYDEVSDLVKSLNTRRNLTITQKTISAYNLWKSKVGYTQDAASESWSVSVRSVKNVSSVVKSAQHLKSTPTNTNIYAVEKKGTRALFSLIKPNDVIETLFNGYFIKVGDDGAITDSLKTIAKHLKALAEDALIETKEIELYEWKADALLKSEAGKQKYYSIVEENMSTDTKISIMNLINHVYPGIDEMMISIPADTEQIIQITLDDIPGLEDVEARAAYIDKKRLKIASRQKSKANKKVSIMNEKPCDLSVALGVG